jgi:nucleoside-diphosphate-sugar epimerase
MGLRAQDLFVESGKTIYEAVRIIDLNHRGIALVVDESERLVGIVTDGDVRRSIIGGVDIHSAVDTIMCRDPLTVSEEVSDEDIVSLVHSAHFKEKAPAYIPAVDQGGRPVRLHRTAELLKFRIQKEPVELTARPKMVLLLGGAGYIGSILTEILLGAGYRVTIVDRFLYGEDSVQGLRESANLHIIRGDTRHIDVLVPVIRDSDAVVHLAELVGDPLCAKDPQATFEINYLATAMISQICSDLQVNRCIYLSSCSVYGASQNPDEILDERSHLAPVSLYAKMKINSERALLSTSNGNFAPCIFRLGTVFGMSHRPRFDLVVNLLTAKAVTEGRVRVFGGEQWRPHVHAADVARAIKLALEAPLESVKNRVFNIVTENMRIIDVGELVAKLIPGTQLMIEDEESDRRNYRVTSLKAQTSLGFRPGINVQDGILEVAAAFRSGRIRNFKDRRFHNYLSEADQPRP